MAPQLFPDQTSSAADRLRSQLAGEAVVVAPGVGDALGARLVEAAGLRVLQPSRSTNRILGLHLLPAIDHILVAPNFAAEEPVRVWRDQFNGVYPSDHYPISARLRWQ